eukprot:2058291-Alexandrium_andersonii.AAC.1
MSASLVGSEMCIRDRCGTATATPPCRPPLGPKRTRLKTILAPGKAATQRAAASASQCVS